MVKSISKQDRRFILMLAGFTIYGFLLLSVLHVISGFHNAYDKIDTSHVILIVGICIACIEVLNHITFRISTNNYRLGRNIKAVAFWVIFTVGYSVLLAMVMQVSKSENPEMAYSLLSFCWDSIGAFILAMYSLNPRFRFLLLHEKFVRP